MAYRPMISPTYKPDGTIDRKGPVLVQIFEDIPRDQVIGPNSNMVRLVHVEHASRSKVKKILRRWGLK